jgi:hypothetical protein
MVIADRAAFTSAALRALHDGGNFSEFVGELWWKLGVV